MARKILLYVLMTMTDDDPTDVEDLEEIITEILNGDRGAALNWCDGLVDMTEECKPKFTVKARPGD